MTRHGRLSKGCQICRKRKIKCDQALPACSQCLKAGWKCPQYGDIVDRMFLNQHQHVNSDNQSLVSTDRRKSSRTQRQHLAESVASKTISKSWRMASFSESHIVDDLATRYFFAEHVFRESGVMRGHFEFLSVYATGVGSSRVLSASLKAVALSAYAQTFQYRELLQKSRIYYSYALRSLQAALLSPTEAVRGSTISSMVLLGTFETLNGEDFNSLSNTNIHMNGALKTISIRGAPQTLKSQHGLQLFLHTSWCRLVSCILRSIPVSAELLKMRRYAASLMNTDDPAWKLSVIMIKVAKFRTDIKGNILYDHQEIMNMALRVDDELLALTENMPLEWQFQRVPIQQQSDSVFGTHFHVYPDLWMACIWNFIRTCRLILHKEILLQTSNVPNLTAPTNLSTSSGQYQRSNQVIKFLISEICATIPQFCDHSAMLKDERLRNMHIERDSFTNGVPATASVYYLFWPLLNAGQATKLDSQRDWIIRRCHYIGQTTGTQQVFALADFLEKREDIDSWFERQDKSPE